LWYCHSNFLLFFPAIRRKPAQMLVFLPFSTTAGGIFLCYSKATISPDVLFVFGRNMGRNQSNKGHNFVVFQLYKFKGVSKTSKLFWILAFYPGNAFPEITAFLLQERHSITW
jgi:hypothetical protein